MQISESDRGLKPEKFDSDVRLTDVSFCYPSRPTVQVTTIVLTAGMPSIVLKCLTGVGQAQHQCQSWSDVGVGWSQRLWKEHSSTTDTKIL